MSEQTEYLHTVTAACPESRIVNGNHLACALGTSMVDMQTYGPAKCQDSDGQRYSVVSFAVKDSTLYCVQTLSLPRPAHDTNNLIDMGAAEQELEDMIVVLPFSGDPETEIFVPVLADPDHIVAYVGYQPHDALRHMGLSLIPTEEG